MLGINCEKKASVLGLKSYVHFLPNNTGNIFIAFKTIKQFFVQVVKNFYQNEAHMLKIALNKRP